MRKLDGSSLVRAAAVLVVALGGVEARLATSATSVTAAPDAAQAQSGKRLYDIYCSTCHGERGTGDGPTAAILTVRPADLTRLARKSDGSFPAEQIERAIDGRNAVLGHGNREMPLWGLAFQDLESDAPQERDVHTKIHALVEYLRSLQE